jgi:hypothetical protein
MKHPYTWIASTVMPAVLAGPVFAASVIYDPITGEARGISDLNVSGTTYDVAFVKGSYDALYAVDTPEFFGDAPLAVNAASEIVSVMLGEPSKPLIYNDLMANQSQLIWVVYGTGIDAFGTAIFQAHQAGANFLQPWQVFPSLQAERSLDFTVSHPGWTFAKFGAPGSFAIPPVATVPLPAGGLLLISGLAALSLRRRRL